MCSSLALPPELIDAQEETVAVYDLLEHRSRHIRIISGARPRQAIGPLAPTVPVKSAIPVPLALADCDSSTRFADRADTLAIRSSETAVKNDRKTSRYDCTQLLSFVSAVIRTR